MVEEVDLSVREKIMPGGGRGREKKGGVLIKRKKENEKGRIKEKRRGKKN